MIGVFGMVTDYVKRWLPPVLTPQEVATRYPQHTQRVEIDSRVTRGRKVSQAEKDATAAFMTRLKSRRPACSKVTETVFQGGAAFVLCRQDMTLFGPVTLLRTAPRLADGPDGWTAERTETVAAFNLSRQSGVEGRTTGLWAICLHYSQMLRSAANLGAITFAARRSMAKARSNDELRTARLDELNQRWSRKPYLRAKWQARHQRLAVRAGERFATMPIPELELRIRGSNWQAVRLITSAAGATRPEMGVSKDRQTGEHVQWSTVSTGGHNTGASHLSPVVGGRRQTEREVWTPAVDETFAETGQSKLTYVRAGVVTEPSRAEAVRQWTGIRLVADKRRTRSVVVGR